MSIYTGLLNNRLEYTCFMRSVCFCLVLTITIALAGAADPGPAAAGEDASSYRFMSFNIRNGRAADGEDAWPNRREHVAALIRDTAPDVVGLQEVFDFQRAELLELLPEYGAWGTGRDAQGGDEQCCILYRIDRLLLLAGGTFWLSEEPGVPGSKSWDSSLPRICTWARFMDREGGGTFCFYNNHFDHIGEVARAGSARLVVQHIAARDTQDPVVVVGDLNTGEDTEPVAVFKETLRDSFRVMHPDTMPAGTFNGFEERQGGPKIDYVFVDDHIKVLDAGILRDTYGDGRNISDHYPVWADVVFEMDLGSR